MRVYKDETLFTLQVGFVRLN